MAQKILIVEDEPSINQLYEIKFKSEGYDVITAWNGVEGLEVAQKFQPDIILLDLLMPEMNGEEMLEKMRKTGWGQDMKVIILTNVSPEEAPDGIRNFMISRYIVKAEMTTDEVVQIVKAALAEQPAYATLHS